MSGLAKRHRERFSQGSAPQLEPAHANADRHTEDKARLVGWPRADTSWMRLSVDGDGGGAPLGATGSAAEELHTVSQASQVRPLNPHHLPVLSTVERR
jgi:hypothetical protein